MNLKLATIWTYVGAVTTASMAVVSYLQTQHLPPPWPVDLGYVGIALAAVALFWKALDASAPSAKKGPPLPLFVLLFVGRMLPVLMVVLRAMLVMLSLFVVACGISLPSPLTPAGATYYVTDANLFLAQAQNFWPTVDGLLPASEQAAATADFNAAVAGVTAAEAVYVDAASGAAATSPAVAFADLQSAVDAVFTFLEQYTATSGDAGVTGKALGATRTSVVLPAALVHEHGVVMGWKP